MLSQRVALKDDWMRVTRLARYYFDSARYKNIYINILNNSFTLFGPVCNSQLAQEVLLGQVLYQNATNDITHDDSAFIKNNRST